MLLTPRRSRSWYRKKEKQLDKERLPWRLLSGLCTAQPDDGNVVVGDYNFVVADKGNKICVSCGHGAYARTLRVKRVTWEELKANATEAVCPRELRGLMVQLRDALRLA